MNRAQRSTTIITLFTVSVLCAGWLTGSAQCQADPTYSWVNFVGQPGGYGTVDGMGTAARFYNPQGVAVDTNGNVYVGDTVNNTIRKLAPVGTNWVVTTIAGTAGFAGAGDGTNNSARFNYPGGVVVDIAGNVYVADTDNHTIRKLTPVGTNWVVTTLAGAGGYLGSMDDTNSAARFNNPQGVAVDNAGNLYVGDTGNNTIRKLTPAGTNWVVTTLAGTAGVTGTADGTNSTAQFHTPFGVAVDTNGNVYVADTNNHAIRKVTPDGIVTTLAGSPGTSGSADGTNSTARFNSPHRLTLGNDGNLYVADFANQTIRKVTLGGVVTTIAGSAGNFGSRDAMNSWALFHGPAGLAADNHGNLFVADLGNSTIRQVTPMGTNWVVTTLAGSVAYYGSWNTTSAAEFFVPFGDAVDGAGNLYVADTYNYTIRRVTSAGVVTTIAGSPLSSGNADGTNSSAQFYMPMGVAVDTNGNVYVADTDNHTIRMLTPVGSNWVVTTIAGSAGNRGSTDGTNSTARFYWPYGVAVGPDGNVYVADSFSETIRKLTPVGTNWVVTTIAGKVGTRGSVDGTNSTARFNFPIGIVVNSAGTIYVTDFSTSIIRQVTPVGTNWVVTTIAGSAGMGGSADGTNSTAQFNSPSSIAMDSAGNLFVADAHNDTIRKVTPVGTNWVVTTIGGTANVIGGADGTNSFANFSDPTGIAVDRAGILYVVDSYNNRISKGTPSYQTPTVTVSVQASPLGGGIVTGSGSYSVGNSVQISAMANSDWTFTGWSDGNPNAVRLINVPVGGTNYTANFATVVPVIVTSPGITNSLLIINHRFVIVVGETNVFNVGTGVPADTLLRYQWAFGDGGTSGWSSNAWATHSYPTNECGPYIASVMISNAQSAAAISSNFTVSAACVLTLTKLQASLNFSKTNADSSALTGKLGLPGITNVVQLTGIAVLVDIGNAQVSFVLDEKGRAVGTLGTCRLVYTKPTKTKSGYWTATIALSKGTWRSQWANYGLDNQTHKSPGVMVTLPAAVMVGTEAFAAAPHLHYTATQKKTGTAK